MSAGGEPNFLNDDSIVRDAQDYLAHLQIDASTRSGASPLVRHDEVRHWLTTRASELDAASRVVARVLIWRHPVMDLAASHARGLIQFVQRPFRAALLRVPVGTVATPDLTIKTTRAPAGGPLIIVPIGFMGTIHAIVERCAAASPYGGRPQISIADAGAYIRRRLRYRPGDRWEEPPFRIRNFIKSVLTGGLGNDAVHFALAHEYAHVLRDYAGTTPAGADAEYDADLLGAELALHAGAHLLNFQSSRRYAAAGAEVVLQSTRVAEALGIVATQKTHPPAAQRIERLHEYWRRRYGRRLLRFLQPLAAIFDAALDGA